MKTKAQALRAVADDDNLSQVEFNKSFVLMQYFGYLGRNPDDLPDRDFSGWQFWFSKLNEFNGNFVNAEMVKKDRHGGKVSTKIRKVSAEEL